MRVHLDTDLGSDVDDLAALVMLLGSPEVEMTGITTSIDPGGRRAGYVGYVLDHAGREDVAVAAGAEVSLTTSTTPGGFPDDDRRWPAPRTRPGILPLQSAPTQQTDSRARRPGILSLQSAPERQTDSGARRPDASPAGSALRLLADSVEVGATIVVIGPSTNLALLGVDRPGLLAKAKVVMMGGWFDLPDEGLPPSGPQRDWNVQSDTTAAQRVLSHAGEVTLVPLPLTFRVHLRRRHLQRLRTGGNLGRLIAFQAENQGAEGSVSDLVDAHAALPDDLLSFQHDPLACATALGWPAVTLEGRHVRPVLEDGVLRFADDPGGRAVQVAVDVDVEVFTAGWLAAVEAADQLARRS